ncbi:formimidoylglutamase [Lacihabitans soyangensis]|uniref:Formimidoylglutamase n=2 Tax=Lacihabitans soyangensis TaxID=869394 RepID=A0AAE3H2B0_9BACT|nr:formimidoylglutamase [Lacihabitans soyangensis]
MENGLFNLKQMYEKAIPWTGRIDGYSDEYLRWHQDIKTENLEGLTESADFGIIGFACDEGVRRNKGRTGAKMGPELIRKACANFPIIENIQIADYGNIVCDGPNLEEAQENLANAVYKIQSKNIKTIVFGGGHEVMFGHYSGLRKAYPNQKIGILNFDAHFDNRAIDVSVGATSGTGFWQIARQDENYNYLAIGIQKNSNTKVLFQEAESTSTTYILAEDFVPENENKIYQIQQKWMDSIDILYVTVCLDVFAAPFAPGVSATAYNGIMPDYFFKKIFRKAISSEKLKAFDIAELNPDHDIDNRTAKLAASFVYEVVNA